MPRPAQADIRCSTVCTLALPLEMVDASRVSVTASARDDDVHRLRQIDAPEHDAGVGRRWPQRQLDPLAAVQTDADGRGQGFEGSLGKHGDYFNFGRVQEQARTVKAHAAHR